MRFIYFIYLIDRIHHEWSLTIGQITQGCLKDCGLPRQEGELEDAMRLVILNCSQSVISPSYICSWQPDKKSPSRQAFKSR